MPRNDPKPFVIYEDPGNRIPASGTELAEIRALRAQIEVILLVIAEKDRLIAEAADMFKSAREITAKSQIIEAREIVKRVRIEKSIKKQEKLKVKLETQIKAVEIDMEQLAWVIGKKEAEVQTLEEQRRGVVKTLNVVALEQQLEELTVEEGESFEGFERVERQLVGRLEVADDEGEQSN